MKIKGVIEDLKIEKMLKEGKRKEEKTNKQKRMMVKIVKIYLRFSLVVLWAVWGQFIFR